MNILIIETVWMGKQKYHFFDKLLLTTFSILPMLSARQTAALTPKKHTLTVVNERYSQIDFNQAYDLVNINFVTSTAPHAYELADRFRKKGVVVVLSGLHPSLMPQEAKEHADSVLVGPAETCWLEVLNDVENHSLQPLYHAKHFDESVCIPPTNIQLPGFVLTGAIQATRGCPYGCRFCPEVSIPSGSQFYPRPVDEVIREIRKLPQKTFMFYDASLTIDPRYTKELFKKMIGLNKHFFCNGNVDVLAHDVELVRLSKQAGCVSWLIGFESTNQTTLDSMGKKTNKVSDYNTAVLNIHKNHMAVVGCFMFGFDTDAVDVFKDTFKMIQELRIDVADFCILTPYPGTPVYHELKKQGRILSEDWSGYNMGNVVFEPRLMKPNELQQGVRWIYQQFYSPSYTIRRIFRGLRFGFYPFFLIIARNMIAMMGARRFRTQKK